MILLRFKFDTQEDIVLKSESDAFNGKGYTRLRVGPYDDDAEAEAEARS